MDHAQPTVIFLHGLNTFGDDLLHLGPVTLGRMDQHVKREFEKLGARLISIDGIGSGSPEEQADVVIQKLAVEKDLTEKANVFLLGNSMGGLVARVVAHILNNDPILNPKNLKVNGLISWGTPHRGARAADLILTFAAENPRLVDSISKLGYDLKKNHSTFQHYSAESLAKFNSRYPVDRVAKEYTFLCAVTARRASPYFWGMYGLIHRLPVGEFTRRLLNEKSDPRPSDGFISLESQSWGETHGPYELDHFGQSGFHQIQPTAAQRVKGRIEFEKLCRDMYTVMTHARMKPS